jgi:hypothetical protein
LKVFDDIKLRDDAAQSQTVQAPVDVVINVEKFNLAREALKNNVLKK